MLFHRNDKKDPVFQSGEASTPSENTLKASAGDNITISIENPNAGNQRRAKAEKNTGRAMKIVCSVLSLAAIGYAVFAVVRFIQANVEETSDKESYLTMTGKNHAESKAVYDSFALKDSSLSFQNSIKDYALVSTRLYLSTHKITPSSLLGQETGSLVKEGYSGYALYNLTSNVSYSSALSTDYESGVFSIDLSHCEPGDYLIYPFKDTASLSKEDIYPVSIHSASAIRETVYTLPDSQKQRKRIVLKNNSASPYTLISVTKNGDKLPDDYYDAVLLSSQYKETEDGLVATSSDESLALLSSVEEAINSEYRYKVKAVSSIQMAAKTNSNVSIAVSDSIEEKYSSIYAKRDGYTTKVLDSSSLLEGYDYYPEIRELTGYLDCAGESYWGVVGNDILSLDESPVGKQAYLIPRGESIKESVLDVLGD